MREAIELIDRELGGACRRCPLIIPTKDDCLVCFQVGEFNYAKLWRAEDALRNSNYLTRLSAQQQIDSASRSHLLPTLPPQYPDVSIPMTSSASRSSPDEIAPNEPESLVDLTQSGSAPITGTKRVYLDDDRSSGPEFQDDNRLDPTFLAPSPEKKGKTIRGSVIATRKRETP